MMTKKKQKSKVMAKRKNPKLAEIEPDTEEIKIVEKKWIYLTYSTSETGGDVKNPDEEWSNRENVYVYFKPKDLYLTTQDWCQEIEVSFIPEAGQWVDVVVVRYESGDTFGRSYGNWHVVGAYLEKDKARKIEQQITRGQYKGYKPWEGYFERLQDVERYDMRI